MKKIIALLLGISVFLGSFIVVSADTWVNGYTKKNGTYVEGHYRSSPDGNPYNNYSFPGNTNPYTGKTAGGSADSYLNNYYSPSTNYSSGSSYSSYSSIPTCPVNSYASGSSCKCNYGYSVSGGACVSNDSQCRSQLGYSSTYDSVSDSCKCDYGYVIGSSGQCTPASLVCSAKIGIMSQYNSSTKTCECVAGYEFNGSTCEYKRTNYSTSSYTDSSSCPLHSSPSVIDDARCTCDSGYSVNGSKTACVVDSPAPLVCPWGNTCIPDPTMPQIGSCPAGYKCTSNSVTPSTSSIKNLRIGDSGNDVIQLQAYLQEKGLLTLPVGVKPGYYGSLTAEAIKIMQRKNNLAATGIFTSELNSLLGR